MILRIALPILLCLVTLLSAQDRPTVGVVLSGGGAKGLAHIGVMQVLEEYGITVDYVGGTSMGAIIGGFYAVGYSAHQMDSIVMAYDLSQVVLGELPRSATPIRQRKYGEKTFLSLTFNKGKLDIPTALSDGQQVYDFLYNNTYPYNQVAHFDSLPRPFFCIATDLATGEEVLLDRGNLPLAMRASAALPTVINPVEIDGRVLIDGGVVNNLPAAAMRAKGADIVIGVSVESGLRAADEIVSATDIFSQVTSYHIVNHSRQQLEECDLVIQPAVDDYALLDFDAKRALIDLGRAAAEQSIEALVKIGTAQHAVAPYVQQSLSSQRKYFKLSEIRIDAPMGREEEYLESHLPFVVDQYMEMKDIYQGINQIQASEYFETVYYDLIPDGDQQVILVLKPSLKRNYQNTFGTAIHYDNFYGAGLLLQSKRRSLLRSDDNLRLDLVIGNRIRYDLNYHINRGVRNSPGFRSSYEYNSVNTKLRNPLLVDSTFSIDELIFSYQDFYNEINLATYKKGSTLVEVAAGIQRFSIESEQLEVRGMANLSFDDTWYLTSDVRYYYDDLDSRQFAMAGRKLDLVARALYPISSRNAMLPEGAGVNLDVQLTEYRPISERVTIGFDLNAGTNFINTFGPMQYSFATANANLINRFRAFPGLSAGEAIGASAVMVAPLVRRRWGDNIYTTAQLRALWIGDPFDNIVTSQGSVFGASLAIGYSTILGPMEVIYGYADQDSEIYINVGYWF